ncbi:MAG: hypothetical protein NC302_08155 [Bacteroidales bacterium]|nr:hypothetical protein [Bacteroidales bacterium]MCM1416345.1 hypothetical protein [bacterium]MCM1423564.1 hypothetical protein [bacterium]
MNCCWIILLLLFCGPNGGLRIGCGGNGNGNNGVGCGGNGNGNNGCGCDEPVRPCMRPEPFDDSRFEPRFEQRPFNGNGSTCGCEAEEN